MTISLQSSGRWGIEAGTLAEEQTRAVLLANILKSLAHPGRLRILAALCGGGGGLVALGEKDFRMKSAKVKADQMRASGAAVICTACENCHLQLSDLNEHYGLGMKIEFVSKLVADALVR